VCLSVREDISGNTRAIFTFFVHVAYVRDSVLLRHLHVDDRPHRLSAGRGDESAQRGRYKGICKNDCDTVPIRYRAYQLIPYAKLQLISGTLTAVPGVAATATAQDDQKRVFALDQRDAIAGHLQTYHTSRMLPHLSGVIDCM